MWCETIMISLNSPATIVSDNSYFRDIFGNSFRFLPDNLSSPESWLSNKTLSSLRFTLVFFTEVKFVSPAAAITLTFWEALFKIMTSCYGPLTRNPPYPTHTTHLPSLLRDGDHLQYTANFYKKMALKYSVQLWQSGKGGRNEFNFLVHSQAHAFGIIIPKKYSIHSFCSKCNLETL